MVFLFHVIRFRLCFLDYRIPFLDLRMKYKQFVNIIESDWESLICKSNQISMIFHKSIILVNILKQMLSFSRHKFSYSRRVTTRIQEGEDISRYISSKNLKLM